MRVLLQRVKKANVKINSEVVGQIESGLLIFLGVDKEDDSTDIIFLSKKICNLRIFSDPNDKMNLSCLDIGGKTLIVSQFTLCANTKKGNRPSYIKAALPQRAEELYLEFIDSMKNILGENRVQTGLFGGNMIVNITNDGPVTIWMDSRNKE